MLSAAGCLFRPEVSTSEFDLCAAKGKYRTPVQAAEFRNSSGSGLRMSILAKDGEIRGVSGARWVQDPGIMVARQLNRLLNSDGSKSAIRVKGTIESFIYDAAAAQFVFAGFYDAGKGLIRFDIRVPVASPSPEAVAAGASAAVKTLAGRLSPEL